MNDVMLVKIQHPYQEQRDFKT